MIAFYKKHCVRISVTEIQLYFHPCYSLIPYQYFVVFIVNLKHFKNISGSNIKMYVRQS